MCVCTGRLKLSFLSFFLAIENLPIELGISHKIYVRKCYPEMLLLLCQKIDHLLINEEHQVVIRVTGTPGMGKSFFLGYVWYHLLRVKRDVVAIVGDEIIRSRSEESGAYDSISHVDFKRLCVSERKVLVLADPDQKVRRTYGITIFFVSPDHEGTDNYPRTNRLDLYMPPWNEEELSCCINKVYPRYAKDFQVLFRRWGGSIRCLTTPSCEDTRNGLLELFLQDQCLCDVVNKQEGDPGILAKEMKKFQWLVRCIPIEDDNGSTDYSKVTLRFPSHFVALQVAKKIRNLKFDWKILGQPRLLGNAYESHVLDSLFKVSESMMSLPVSAMKVSNKEQVSVPAVKNHCIFSSNTVIEEPEEGTLYIPIEPNRPGLDLIMPPWVFQVTIAKSHTAKKLDKTLNQFPSVTEWEICFVLPSAIFEEFTTPRLSHYPSIKNKYKLCFDFE
jgi:DNA polymerase elongation subunit (family B)